MDCYSQCLAESCRHRVARWLLRPYATRATGLKYYWQMNRIVAAISSISNSDNTQSNANGIELFMSRGEIRTACTAVPMQVAWATTVRTIEKSRATNPTIAMTMVATHQ